MPLTSLYLRRAASGFAVLACCLVAGCRHKQPSAYVPPPPEAQQRTPKRQLAAPMPVEPATPQPNEKILWSIEGVASWYGEPYHNSHAANGQVYQQDAMTAANRVLPMGSIVRVTNLTTNQSIVVTITDRGPFVPGRIIDLSRGAATKAGIRQMGIARVRVDVLQAPKPVHSGGKWAVQIGAFKRRSDAVKLRDQLQRWYPTARVMEFAGNADYWVRIRPQDALHSTAKEIIERTHPVEGQAYLVRMD